MKNFINAMGNRTRDLSASGAVPQPTPLPRAPAFTHEAVIFAEQSSEILHTAYRTVLLATGYSFCCVVADKRRDSAGSVCERPYVTHSTFTSEIKGSNEPDQMFLTWVR